jgi:DNA-binding NarL/FixJ family response regulator
MADGKTNATISNTLGYSESTVRQETIKIFFKLGCKDREEAANYFNSRRKTS